MIAQATLPVQPSTAVPHPIWSTRLARPEHPVLMASGLTWTAKNLAESVLRTAGRMHADGVTAGEVVALCGPPSPEWVIALHALGWLGAVAAPLAPGAPVGEQARCLERADATRVLLTHGLTPAARDAVRDAAQAAGCDAKFATELPLGKAPPERFWPLDEPRVIVFTSGSGGEPKAIHLSAAQILLSAFGSAIRLGHEPEDRWLACLPFHHVGGLSILYRCAFYGTTVVLHQRFRPRAVARALDAGDASLVSLVPTMLEQVLDARPEEPFPASVRAILLGGDAAPERLLARCRALGAPVALTWGMTEAASQVATSSPGDLGPSAGVGAPLAFARVEADALAGVLTVRGPLSAGEVETRDLGAVDPRGRVHVLGRAEEFIKSGGETIALREVEDVLREHPAVRDVAVVGCVDAHWGQRPAALLVPVVGVEGGRAPLEAEALRTWCRERLSGFKVPDRFRWVEALPRTALGKLARADAAALLDGVPARPPVQAPPSQAPPAVEAGDPNEARPTTSASAPPVLGRLLLAAERYGAGPFRARLGEVQEHLSADLIAVEADLAAVAERLDRPPHLRARSAARHLLALPGKRVRPLCVVLAARMGGRPVDAAVRNAAVACELIHAATLLHDDVIDEGTERRGAPAARVVFGNSASVLAGDFLFTDALSLVGQVGQPELLDRLLGVVSDMVEAEALQLERRGRLDPDRAAYLRVVDGKTASLFRWGLWAGGMLGGLPAGACAALGRAGEALGVAFQLVDDVLDVAGDVATIGKDGLADLRQGKLTWPLIRAVELDPSLKTELAALAAPVPPADAEARLATLLDRVQSLGAVEETQAFAREQGERALDELATLPADWPRWMLEAIVEVVVDRSH